MATHLIQDRRQAVENVNAQSTVLCPACGFDFSLACSSRIGQLIKCNTCSTPLQVIHQEPLWVDLAPQPDQDDSAESMDLIELDPDIEDLDPDIEDLDLEKGAAHIEMMEDIEDMEEDDSDNEDDNDSLHEDIWSKPSLPWTQLGRRRGMANSTSQQENFLTPEGRQRKLDELEFLKQHRMPQVIAWLGETLSEGFDDEDVTELEVARTELSFTMERIRNLENLLNSAELLAEPENKDLVQLGSWVTILERESTEPETYRLVSPAETDPLTGSMSNQSPLGKALMNQRVNDSVIAQSPDGPIEFKIIAIS